MWNTYIYTHVLLAFLYNRNQLIDHPLRPVVSHAKGRNNRTRNRTMLTRLSARRQGEKEKRARPQRRRSTLIIKITPPRGSFFLPNDRSQCQLLFAPSPPLLLIFLRRKKRRRRRRKSSILPRSLTIFFFQRWFDVFLLVFRKRKERRGALTRENWIERAPFEFHACLLHLRIASCDPRSCRRLVTTVCVCIYIRL